MLYVVENIVISTYRSCKKFNVDLEVFLLTFFNHDVALNVISTLFQR